MAELTTYEEVLAQMGVSYDEFPENSYEDFSVEDELKLDLHSWFPQYAEVLNSTTLTDDEKIQRSALRIYNKVFCAYSIMQTAPMRFIQQRGDGDNAQRRFQSATSLTEFLGNLSAKLASSKSTVLSLTTDFTPVEEEFEYKFPGIGVSSPSVDKITGV